MQFLKYIFSLFLINVCTGEDDSELIAVSALIRHGIRIPLSYYPSDPNKNHTWTFVGGDLTNGGIEEMYDVGKWLRKKYHRFLSQKYDPNEFYAHSVQFDRCLMTAEATLAGLYQPIGDEIWNKHVRWQPIPIHSTPTTQDILADMLDPCPSKITAAANVIYKSPEYTKFQKESAPLFDYISKHAGEAMNITALYPFFDTLFSEKSVGLELPSWAEKIYQDLFPFVVKYTELESLSRVEQKIQTGPLLTNIHEQFKNAITDHNFGTTNTIFRKFMAYFSTEWMLYDLTYGFGLDSIGVPDYGALYLIELRKRSEEYYVNILYRNASRPGTKAQRWHVRGGKFNLKYEDFKKRAEPLLTNTTDWVPLCEKFVHEKAHVVTGVPMT